VIEFRNGYAVTPLKVLDPDTAPHRAEPKRHGVASYLGKTPIRLAYPLSCTTALHVVLGNKQTSQVRNNLN